MNSLKKMSEEMILPQLSQSDVEQLSHLLKEWKLLFLLPQFIVEKIDLDILKIIDVSHIKLLLSNFPIGVQMRFVHNLMEWRKNQGVPLNEKTCNGTVRTENNNGLRNVAVSSSKSVVVSRNLQGENTVINKNSLFKFKLSSKKKSQVAPMKILDLTEILMTSQPNGLDLLDIYGKQNYFTPHDRKRLIMTIVNYFLECKMPMTLQISYELENAIVRMFPSESLQKYRNSRYGKLYLCYLREKTQQVDSESYSDHGEHQENLLPLKDNNNVDYDDDDDDDDDDDEGNTSYSLLCDLYDKECGEKSFDGRRLDGQKEEELFDEPDILIQTIYEDCKKFVKIPSPYDYKQFLSAAQSIFNINGIDEHRLYHKELEIDEFNFKSTILQHYKSLTFTVELKIRNETSQKDISDILPDANRIRNMPNLLAFVKISDAGRPFPNSYRTMIAKVIMEECLSGNSERILKRNDFLALAENICKAFHTEVPSTYYVPCRDGQPARGKLINAYNNKRYTLSALGHLKRRPPRTAVKRKRYTYAEEDDVRETLSRNQNICESKEFSQNTNLEMEELSRRWRETYELRQKELADGLRPSEYFQKYSVLKTIRGVDLVEIDVKTMYPKMGGIDDWLAFYDVIVERARGIRNFRKVKKGIEAIDASKDKRYRASLALNLLAYIFPYTWRFSKSVVQERFLKEYATMEDLKSDSDPVDLQIRFIHQSQQVVYADFCICGFIFKCVDLLEALMYLFHYIHALRLPYPRTCLRIWQFVQLAIFKFKTDDVMLPQIECTINDLLYKTKRKKE